MLMHTVRYRTPLCILFPARTIAAGCYVLAQYLVDGTHSQSLDARLSLTPPSASLPTPPTHKAASPDASRIAIEFWELSESDLTDVAEVIAILLEYYNAHDLSKQAHLQVLATVSYYLFHLADWHADLGATQIPLPTLPASRVKLYTTPFSQLVPVPQEVPPPRAVVEHTRTPSSTHGDSSPTGGKGKGWKPLKPAELAPSKRLDLS
jgi:cyclin K